jgi:predicted XRE-type DNA-binding protein
VSARSLCHHQQLFHHRNSLVASARLALRQKDIAQCFGIPASMLGDMQKNSTKISLLTTAAVVLMQSDIGRPDSTTST